MKAFYHPICEITAGGTLFAVRTKKKKILYLMLRGQGGCRRDWRGLMARVDRGGGGRSSSGDGTWSSGAGGGGGIEGNADGGRCALK